MKPILMSADNPSGHKLEDLLQAVRLDIEGKNLRLAADSRYSAQIVLRNNKRIMELLREAEGVQLETMAELARLGPDQGPTGKPRLGAGSDGGPAAIHKDRVTR